MPDETLDTPKPAIEIDLVVTPDTPEAEVVTAEDADVELEADSEPDSDDEE